jgi:hypothetical protein
MNRVVFRAFVTVVLTLICLPARVVSSFLCKRLVESCALFRESVFP